MAVTARKYNPGFLTDDELVASFCVRTSEFESMVEMLRDCTGSSNPHQIVTGPRGSGKTSLLLRIAAEVRRDSELSSRFFPIVFAEESYEVATAGEFWLECLSRLAAQAPSREGGPDLQRTVEELRTHRDDRTLAERCLVSLLDFSDREDKRLVLMVENLNMMFRDMADADTGWRLRHTLQNEPRILMLASATSRFDEIDNPEHALYDLFRVHTLRPLNTKECAVLWETVSGRCPAPKTIRSLEILTGGSPRLLTIVARFGAVRSFRELMADLLDLVDDHTEYFKSHIESLPPQERRVYLALAELWKPATTREVADRSRLETSKCSAQLARLIERGVVQIKGGTARRKQYYLTERLYNIYYLMRRSRGASGLVEALIQFMASYYSPSELKDLSTRVARDALVSDPETQPLHRAALVSLMALPALAGYRRELLAMIPSDLAEVLDLARLGAAKPDHYRDDQFDEQPEAASAKALLEEAVALDAQNRPEEAVAAYDAVIQRCVGNETSTILELVAAALVNKGAMLLIRLNRPEAALAVFDEVTRRFASSGNPNLWRSVAVSFLNKSAALSVLNRTEEALTAFDEVVQRFGSSETTILLEQVAVALVNKGAMLGELGRPEEALTACDEVVRRFGRNGAPAFCRPVAKAFVNKGMAHKVLNRMEDALAAFDEVVCRFGHSESSAFLDEFATALVEKGIALGRLDRPLEALATFDTAVRRFRDGKDPSLLRQVVKALVNQGVVLAELNRPEDALAALDEAVNRFGSDDTPAFRDLVAKAFVSKGAVLSRLNLWDEAVVAYDEVVRRFGSSGEPALLELVATALVNKGLTLGILNRQEEALATFDEVTRRFGTSKEPALLKLIAAALVARGVALDASNRSDQALTGWDEVVHQFAASDVPAVLEQAAIALVNKASVLLRLNRPEEALIVCDELVNRFEASETPDMSEQVASAFLDKGAALDTLDRPEDALAAYDEVVRRFGASETLGLLESVAKALVNSGSILSGLNRTEEALAVYDEVVRRFNDTEGPVILEEVVTAFVCKGYELGNLNRPDEALATCDEVEQRFGNSDYVPIRGLTEDALLVKANIELKDQRYRAAIDTAGHVLDQHRTESPENRLAGHQIRAVAALATGNLSGCEQDIKAILAILPEVTSLSKPIFNTLMAFSIELGPSRMRQIIQASPSAKLLLPLTTALERELGIESRVAREVEEVAQDIQRDLAKLREDWTMATSGEKLASPASVHTDPKNG